MALSMSNLMHAAYLYKFENWRKVACVNRKVKTLHNTLISVDQQH
jgi:hypothetical protein